jgi:hypothetical protein
MSLCPNNDRDKAIEDWFSKAANDLKSAKLLYANKIFDYCLYHLQQSNEKLVKAMLLSIGIQTPKKSKEDLRIQSVLGFLPKQPSAYGHRTMRSLISDLEKTVPFIDEFWKLAEDTELGPRIASFREIMQASKRSIKKLKKKPFGLIEKTEQLEKEIRATQIILDASDQTANKVQEELDKLDPAQLVRAAIYLMRREGYRVDASQPPSFDKIKAEFLPKFRLSVLLVLSAALASFLDPLEPITRYPDSQHGSFDENDPYVKNFSGLYDVIASILQKARVLIRHDRAEAR